MSASRVDLILRQLDGLPALPAAVVRVLEATGRPGAEATDVVAAVEADPALAGRVLQLVYRADTGVRDVASLERAVVLLGFAAVRSAALAVGVLQAFPVEADPKSDNAGVRRGDFWTHSLAVACAAELLAERLPGSKHKIEPAEAFCCGLLHDLGKLALSTALPKSYARIVQATDVLRDDIAGVERQVIGVDHAAAGRRLAERWHLPASVRDVIWLHNQHPDALPDARSPTTPLVLLVTLADQLARSRHLGYSGNHSFGVPRGLLLTRLGLTQADVEFALTNVVDRMAPRSAALGLDGGDAQALYRQALDRASTELQQTQSRLNEQSRRGAAKARCFAALAEFQHELHPDATTDDLLVAIAQTAAGVLDCGPIAAFSFAPNESAAEMVLIDTNRVALRGQAAEDAESPALRPVRPNGGGDGPVRPAGDDLEWLTGVYGPSLRAGRRWWLRLDGAGETIGGVVWGGGEREPERLEAQIAELRALTAGWSLALRMAQERAASRALADQLSEANRRLGDAQEQMARDRTTLAIAELAAGAAHEMNNPLMVISGRSQLLYHGLKDGRHKQSALAVFENAGRLSDMITQLMHFAKPSAATTETTGVDAVVSEAMSLVANLPERANRRVELNLPDLPPVRVDKAQLARALAAILENALQATAEHHGLIEIHAALDAVGRRLVLTATDNGIGMDADTLRHAFDPFFSKKAAGRRRGMGLPVALRLVEINGGALRLDSREGVGTRAVITLPLASGENALDPSLRLSA